MDSLSLQYLKGCLSYQKQRSRIIYKEIREKNSIVLELTNIQQIY